MVLCEKNQRGEGRFSHCLPALREPSVGLSLCEAPLSALELPHSEIFSKCPLVPLELNPENQRKEGGFFPALPALREPSVGLSLWKPPPSALELPHSEIFSKC